MSGVPCWRSPGGIAAMASLAATAAYAQSGATPAEGLRVEVTGSNIPRAEIETALPVQVLTREDIERSGSTTVAELMSRVSANMVAQTDATSIGSGAPGLSSINLRGIGAGDTLVLLNGRRVANYAFDGSAVDRRDGFIHLSAAHQVRETAKRHFAGQDGLLLVGFLEDTLENLRCAEQ